jgi:hypothetical protein
MNAPGPRVSRTHCTKTPFPGFTTADQEAKAYTDLVLPGLPGVCEHAQRAIDCRTATVAQVLARM